MIKLKLEQLRKTIDTEFNSLNSISYVNLKTHLHNFCDYVEAHQTTSYYPISRLFEASKCSTPIEVLKVTNYLTSEEVGFLTITFCYYPIDSDDVIEISPEDYNESITNNLSPVDSETGVEINNFDRSRLGFFCYLKVFEQHE